ncbi:MAG TPA: hypothetical protein VNI77_01055 [Nitrososphaera sp.]|nr:hypothetical protein [Nitrososphaera sp.]
MRRSGKPKQLYPGGVCRLQQRQAALVAEIHAPYEFATKLKKEQEGMVK